MKLILFCTAALLAQDHSAHHEAVDKRGDRHMGFSHEKTTHHFRLAATGGAIEVTANQASDTASHQQIRSHLRHIAQKFTAGDFKVPMLIHDRVPPGVPVMQERRAAIRYSYREIPQGASVRIETADPKALEAVHAFLRFQIEDHRTGDPVEVPRP